MTRVLASLLIGLTFIVPGYARHPRKNRSEPQAPMAVPADHDVPPAELHAAIRLNQLGFINHEPKLALLMATKAAAGTFEVVDDSTGKVVYSDSVPEASLGKWSARYAFIYPLDFSALAVSGRYSIRVAVGSAKFNSVPFDVREGASLYGPLLSNTLAYFKTSRDGKDVDPTYFSRAPAHLNDLAAAIYTTPTLNGNGSLVGALTPTGANADVAGGWFDAGDYLKFVETETYVAGLMLFALREYPNLLASHPEFLAESRFGLEWLLKMWNPQSKTLLYQVGLGDGNGTVLGDHAVWRLPEVDDNLEANQANYFLKFRPAFIAGPAGARISPNLAGRLAAALALGSQIFRAIDQPFADRCLQAAEAVFDLAQTENVKQLLTAANFGYYPEVEWRDDLEWGAAELFFALKKAGDHGGLSQSVPHSDSAFYLASGMAWARNYIAGTATAKSRDTFNLYDVSALAHYEMYRATESSVTTPDLAQFRNALVADLSAQLDQGVVNYKSDPFGFGMEYTPSDDPAAHAGGFAMTARLYRDLTGLDTYDAFARSQRDWLLGKNAWGSSFVIGAGTTFPRNPQHQIANLVRDSQMHAYPLMGAVVSGFASGLDDESPGDGVIVDDSTDNFAEFNRDGALYRDHVTCWQTVEPAIDYTAPTLVVFAQQL